MMKLQQRAEQMIEFARQHPWVDGQSLLPYRHELPRGLVLVYTETNGAARLALTRLDVPPSELEEQICQRAFGAPPLATRHVATKGDYHHVVWAWSTQPPYLKVIYPAAPWLAVPAGSWSRADDKVVVEYQDYEEMFWSVTLSVIAKEVEAERAKDPEQISMFEQQVNHYGRD